MSTTAPPRSARLEAARTRRMLEDTALSAAGGGVLLALEQDPLDADVWRADIARSSGEHARVELDRRLHSVTVQDAAVLAAA